MSCTQQQTVVASLPPSIPPLTPRFIRSQGSLLPNERIQTNTRDLPSPLSEYAESCISTIDNSRSFSWSRIWNIATKQWPKMLQWNPHNRAPYITPDSLQLFALEETRLHCNLSESQTGNTLSRPCSCFDSDTQEATTCQQHLFGVVAKKEETDRPTSAQTGPRAQEGQALSTRIRTNETDNFHKQPPLVCQKSRKEGRKDAAMRLIGRSEREREREREGERERERERETREWHCYA